MKEAPPYRPFRLMGHVAVAFLVALVVWFSLALLTYGIGYPPLDGVEFESVAEAKQQAFREHGLAWPGSRVVVEHERDGVVLERRWLAWSEVRVHLDHDLTAATPQFERGTADTIQESAIICVALILGGIVFLAFRRNARLETMRDAS